MEEKIMAVVNPGEVAMSKPMRHARWACAWLALALLLLACGTGQAVSDIVMLGCSGGSSVCGAIFLDGGWLKLDLYFGHGSDDKFHLLWHKNDEPDSSQIDFNGAPN